MTLEAKNLGEPEDKRSFEHGEPLMVRVGGSTIGRAVFRPGWRWSTDVKPIVGTSFRMVNQHLRTRTDVGGYLVASIHQR